MQLAPAEGKKSIRVTFEDEKFFIPLTAKGMQARAEGVTKIHKLAKPKRITWRARGNADAQRRRNRGRGFVHRHGRGTDAEVTPLQVRDLVEVVRERHHAAAGLLPVEVLVRGVVAVLGQREAEEEDRAALRTFSIERTAPIEPPSRTKTGSLPKANFIALRTASASGPVVGALYGSIDASADDLHVRVALLHEVAHELQIFFGS